MIHGPIPNAIAVIGSISGTFAFVAFLNGGVVSMRPTPWRLFFSAITALFAYLVVCGMEIGFMSLWAFAAISSWTCGFLVYLLQPILVGFIHDERSQR